MPADTSKEETGQPGTSKRQGLGKVFGLVAILTVLSKFAGLARDIVVAGAFGTGWLADAYNTAYMFTGNVLVLFGGLGGPFHSCTVSVFTPKKGNPELGRLLSQLLFYTFVTLTLICLAVFLLAPYLAPLWPYTSPSGEAIAPDIKAKFYSELVYQLRVMIPMVLVAGIIGILYGIANIYEQYFWPSLSPAIASIAIIIAIACYPGPSSDIKIYGGWCLAIGTMAGAVGQLLAQVPSLFKTDLKWGLSLKPEPETKEYASMFWPAVFSTSIGQLTVYVDSWFAGQCGQGGWTAIVFSNRLVQLPLGVLLTAMLVPILPRFTEQVAGGRVDDLKVELARALRLLWFLALPLSALLMAIPGSILELLFQRGNWTIQSTMLVTSALLFLTPSIFFYVARDLMTRVFYAHQDSKTPYIVALTALIVKTFLDWILVGPFNIAGINLATTLITILNLSLLTYFLRKKIGNIGLYSLVKPVSIMLIASLAAGFVAFMTDRLVQEHIALGHFFTLFASVGIASVASLAVYIGICVLFKLEEPMLVLKRIRKK